MKKLWRIPALEVLSLDKTELDVDPGTGGDGMMWVENTTGDGGLALADLGDRRGPSPAAS